MSQDKCPQTYFIEHFWLLKWFTSASSYVPGFQIQPFSILRWGHSDNLDVQRFTFLIMGVCLYRILSQNKDLTRFSKDVVINKILLVIAMSQTRVKNTQFRDIYQANSM